VRVKVQLFAVARERARQSVVDLDLPEQATVAALKKSLAEACPSLAPMVSVLRVAVNSEYAADSQVISPGAELAVIPPVSGG